MLKLNTNLLPNAATSAAAVLAGEEGFEPSNAGIKIRCLNQLGDSPMASTPMKQHCKTDAFLAPEPQNLSIFAGVAFAVPGLFQGLV